ncbi:conserved protein of unknown function [Tenacibaculum sp. 190524A02b]|uniref:hypothetical protein n=1 Tax=Tenacibaculum vairaonense TaxID=3137860 RepID=UPI0032B103C1
MNNQNSKKCKCSAKNKLVCPNCSAIKMVMLLKNGNNHLKYERSNGGFSNPVWYNHLSKNNKTVNTLVTAMFRRFQTSIYANVTNKVIFYDNETKEEIRAISV